MEKNRFVLSNVVIVMQFPCRYNTVTAQFNFRWERLKSLDTGESRLLIAVLFNFLQYDKHVVSFAEI